MTTTRSPHAAIAATRLQSECGLFSTDEDCAEAIVQAAIEAETMELRRRIEELEAMKQNATSEANK